MRNVQICTTTKIRCKTAIPDISIPFLRTIAQKRLAGESFAATAKPRKTERHG
jgi:hypothetical protein